MSTVESPLFLNVSIKKRCIGWWWKIMLAAFSLWFSAIYVCVDGYINVGFVFLVLQDLIEEEVCSFMCIHALFWSITFKCLTCSIREMPRLKKASDLLRSGTLSITLFYNCPIRNQRKPAVWDVSNTICTWNASVIQILLLLVTPGFILVGPTELD